MIKNTLMIFFVSAVVIVVVYITGPVPEPPNYIIPKVDLPDSLSDLETKIKLEEKSTKGLKPDNEARIIWNDSTNKRKTKVALLFLHGFTASPMASAPFEFELAKKFESNAYIFRNAHHGIDLGDSTMVQAKSDDYIYAAEKSLAISKKLGEEVVIVGTSLGGALAIYLASMHPEIKALVLYSPGIRNVDENAKVLISPWGLQLAKLVTGSSYIDTENKDLHTIRYFTTHAHFNGAVASVNFMMNAMNKETFQKIKCATLLCYWYKNEQVQDNIISVKSMLEMYDALSTPPDMKRQISFPNAGNHDIASPHASGDYKNVQLETEKFLREVVLN